MMTAGSGYLFGVSFLAMGLLHDTSQQRYSLHLQLQCSA